jgi:hypothetical protein
MADLVLQDSLVEEYLKFKDNKGFDKSKTQKLLKYILPFPLKISHPFIQDPAMIMALEGSDPLIEITDECDDTRLVQMSRLKLMLIGRAIVPAPAFTSINILGVFQEKLQPKYGATYPNATDKAKAQAHIKALLSDATKVMITDSYIDSGNEWNENKRTLQNILPMANIELTIKSGSQFPRNGSMHTERPKLDSTKEEELKQLCTDWQVQPSQILNTHMIHDRYIQTNKVKILLSSGLYHLSTSSAKDFTYIIELI